MKISWQYLSATSQKLIFISVQIALACMSQSILSGQGFTTVERYADLSEHHRVNHIVIDKDDHKYVATAEGLYKIEAGTNRIEAIIEGEEVQQLAWDNRSGLWASKKDSVIFQPFTGFSYTFTEQDLKITCMDASMNQLFIGTNKGLFKVALKDEGIEFRRSQESKLLGKVAINAIFVDPQRVRWIGTDQGVFRIEDNKLRHYEKKSRITAFTYTYEGVWIVSDDEMWLVDQYNRWAPVAVRRGLSEGRVTALAADKRAQVYLASDVLVQFNPYTDAIYTLDESYGFVNSISTTLACDREDQVWVGTATEGLFKIRIKTEDRDQLTAVLVKEQKLDCPGDADAILRVMVSGGIPPYRYEWNDPQYRGDYLTDLTAGEYQLSVLDSTGREFEVSTTIVEPEPMTIEVIETRPASGKNRKDGFAEITVKGGKGPYEIEWSSGGKGAVADRLAVGSHLVTIVDANGCLQSAEVLIEAEKMLSGLTVERLDVGTTVNIEKLFFEADSSAIQPASFAVLDEIYDFLTSNRNVVIEIGGHTNSIPPDDYCDRLSTERARAVALYLYQKGIREGRISYKGYGKRNPIATNETRAGRLRNQRVEIKVLSLGG